MTHSSATASARKTTVKAAVVLFPGSSGEHDCAQAWEEATEEKLDFIWHKESQIANYDLIILPAGFSFGDYLRCGAIACHSPIMDAVLRHASEGRLIIGMGNGFQILCESGLLPGALSRNRDLLFICKNTYLKVENNKTAFTSGYDKRQVISLPIAHGEGRFFIDSQGLKKLKDNGQIVFRYCSAAGESGPKSAPDGSLDNIAAIVNEKGNVFGLMPLPERLSQTSSGLDDGKVIFQSIFKAALGQGEIK